MPFIEIIENPTPGSLVHFFRESQAYIDGPYKVIKVGVEVMNVATKKSRSWPEGTPCRVTPQGGIAPSPRIAIPIDLSLDQLA